MAVLALAACAAAVAGACLPDLAPFPAAPDVTEPPAPTQSLGCGDGIIETLDDGGDAGESCDPGDGSVEGCESCRFTCSGAIDDAGHCYFFVDPTSRYDQAVTACRRSGAHLVTFASARELGFANALAGDAGPYWVGLAITNTLGAYGPPTEVREPGWPSGGDTCPGCYAAGADDAGAFAVHPDEDASAAHQCLVADHGTWFQVPCVGTQARRTMCEREPVGQRIDGCGGLLCTTLQVTVGSKRYVVHQYPQTADEASQLCKDRDDGGLLVMLDTREEREQLAREIAHRFATDPPLEVWIGLSNKRGAWTWDDDQPIDGGRPLPWGSGEPAASTGRAFLRMDDTQFDTQLAHTDPDASATRIFVCQHPVD